MPFHTEELFYDNAGDLLVDDKPGMPATPSTGQKGLTAVNNTPERAHAEVGTMYQAFLKDVSGGDATLYNFGKEICSFCKTDVKKMSLVLYLNFLTVREDSTGNVYEFKSQLEFYNKPDGGKTWGDALKKE